MKYKNKPFILSFVMMPILLSSCAQMGTNQGEANNTKTVASLNTLPAQTMDKGECVTFLWAEQTNRPLIYTQNMNSSNATLLIENKSVSAPRSSAEENIVAGFYKKQTFTADSKTIEVRINPNPVRNIYEGIKIPTGVITIEDANGSRSIIPVSGMLGCNLEN